MILKKLLIYSFIFISSLTFSQKELLNLDYNELKSRFFDNPNDLTKQRLYAKIILEKAKSEKNSRQIVKAYYLNSLASFGKTKIKYLDSVIKYSINTNDENFPNSAYCEKAAELERQFKFKEAMDNYLLAEKYAQEKNKIDDYYTARFYIARSKSENLGEISEAIILFQEIFQYYNKISNRDLKQSSIYKWSVFGLADSYKALKKTNLATYYNKLGYKLAIVSKDDYMLNMFTLNEGANQILNRNYYQALDSIKKTIPMIKQYNDKPNLMAAYHYLGKTYEGLGNSKLAIQNFALVDSMYKKDKIMYPELIGSYHFLISYYRKNGDKQKQLDYLTRYISIDSAFQQSHNKMYKLLVKKYDIPHLFKEKELLIKSLKNNNSYFLILLFVLVALLLGLLYYQYRIKLLYKERFKKIITDSHLLRVEMNKQIENDINENNFETANKQKDIKNISREVEERILKGLSLFESEKQYLNQSITLQTLSKDLNTNSVYLSRIINTHKEKKFNDYINDLRIDECIIKIQENNELLKYTIEAIAQEFGFNNEVTFSNAFQKRMKLKPSFFISELKKILSNSDLQNNQP